MKPFMVTTLIGGVILGLAWAYTQYPIPTSIFVTRFLIGLGIFVVARMVAALLERNKNGLE